jgi:hypothetical protein
MTNNVHMLCKANEMCHHAYCQIGYFGHHWPVFYAWIFITSYVLK